MYSRAIGGALLLAGAGFLLLPTLSDAQETAGFASFSLAARAAGHDLIFDSDSSPAHPAGQGTVPETVATLEAGPIGRGFSSLAWPGPLAGNLGSLLIVAGTPPAFGPVPTSALNSPVRAEANSPSGPADAKLEPFPGSAMVAHAEETLVTATGSTAGQAVPGAYSTGSTATATKVNITASEGRAEASSKVTDIAFGPSGVLAIGSVTSTATGRTDGVDASAEGTTVVSGVTVAGQPGSIDAEGIHLAGQNSPNPATAAANQAAAQALTGAGITAYAVAPSTVKSGSTISYNAGSVVLVWAPPGSGTITTITLGGSSVKVSAAPGDPSLLEDVVVDTPPAVLDSGTGDGGVGAVPESGAVGTLTSPRPSRAVDGGRLGFGVPAGYGGLAPAAVLLVLGTAFFTTGFLKRLPDDVLTEPARACPLDDGSRSEIDPALLGSIAEPVRMTTCPLEEKS